MKVYLLHIRMFLTIDKNTLSMFLILSIKVHVFFHNISTAFSVIRNYFCASFEIRTWNSRKEGSIKKQGGFVHRSGIEKNKKNK